jgi:hypothetical protein
MEVIFSSKHLAPTKLYGITTWETILFSPEDGDDMFLLNS